MRCTGAGGLLLGDWEGRTDREKFGDRLTVLVRLGGVEAAGQPSLVERGGVESVEVVELA